MIEIHHGNGIDFVRSTNETFDAIITDPMYDQKIDISEFRRICNGVIIMFCAPENRFFPAEETAYWIKTPSTKNYTKHIGRFVELILISQPILSTPVFNSGLHWSNYTGVYDDLLMEGKIHPFQKPTSLLERLIRIYTRPGDRILDPFMGSGTTGIAAKISKRNFVGYEIDDEYYYKAWERFCEFFEVNYDYKSMEDKEIFT